MSEKIGTVTLEQERRPQFMQIQAPAEKGDYLEKTAREIDCAVCRIIEQYSRVKRLLAGTRSALHEGARLLLEQEVMTGADLKAIMNRG